MLRKNLAPIWSATLAVFLPLSAAQAEYFDFDCGDQRGYQEGAAWPAAGGCSTRLGLAGVKGARTADVNWAHELGKRVSPAVIAADGTQYVGVDKTLRAIAEDGTLRWASKLGGKLETAAAIGRDGVVYAAEKEGTLVAVDPRNGHVLWRYEGAKGYGIKTAPLIDGRGTIYVVDRQGTLHAVAANGAKRWSRKLDGDGHSDITMSRDDLTLYVGSVDKSDDEPEHDHGPKKGEGKPAYGLRALRASDGTVRWSALSNEKVTAPAIGKDGTLHVASDKGRLVAIYPHNGSVKWSVDQTSCACGEWKKIHEAPSIGPDGSILFGTHEGILVQVSRAGQVQWALDLGLCIPASPVLDEDGVAYVPTRGAVYAIDSSGTVLWALSSPSKIYSGVAIGGQGTVYFGTKYGQYYSIGKGPASRPGQTLPVQPLVPIGGDRDGDGTGDPIDPRVSYCGGLPFPPAASQRGTGNSDLTRRGFRIGRPGLSVAYVNNEFEVSVSGPVSSLACSPRLCDIDNNPLPQELSDRLLNFDSEDPAAWDALPANVRQPCEVLSTGPCRVPDFMQADYSAPCGEGDPACAAGFECAMVCPAGAGGVPQAECETRSPVCVALADNPLCERNEDLSEGEECLAVQECTRADDMLTRDEATVRCDAEDCESIGARQTAEITAPPTPTGTPEQPEDLETLGIDNLADDAGFCSVENRHIAGKPLTSGGSPSSAGGGAKKWGISQSAGFDTSYDMQAGPLGVPLPSAHGGAHFTLTGTVWGKQIPVVNLAASADASLIESTIQSEATFTLFGQQIAAVKAGASLDQELGANADFASPKAALEMVQTTVREYESTSRARLAQLARAYKRVFYAPDGSKLPPEAVVISQKLCKAILGAQEPLTGEGAAYLVEKFPETYEAFEGGVRHVKAAEKIMVDPICDAPLTGATAKVVLNELVRRYHESATNLEDDVRGAYDRTQPGSAWSKFEDALALQHKKLGSGTKSFFDPARPKPVYESSVSIPSIEPEFSLVAASAVFPIGPLALVLDVQGTGYWGIEGDVKYGFETALDNPTPSSSTKLVRLFANASVKPYAGITLDLYVGVGFDFGIGGASVGINGDLKLVEVGVPVGGQTELFITQRELSADQVQPVQYPETLAGLFTSGAPLLSPKRFVLGTSSGVRAGLEVTALKGDLNLALRVKLLFAKKTWKKKIADLKGFKKDYYWVWSKDNKLGEVTVPSPNLEYVASIQWPDVAEFAQDVFEHLPAEVEGLGSISADSVDKLRAKLAGTYRYFHADRQMPNFSPGWRQLPETVDRWESTYGAGAVAVQAQNELATTTVMSGSCQPVIIIQ